MNKATRGVPDPIHHTDPSEGLEYITGWNDCRAAMLAEQPAQPYKGIADQTNQVTNGRMRIDPVTGDVGIGTPSSQPMHPEIKKMYEDYFDKCFRESSPTQRPWVGLTDAEIWELAANCLDSVAGRMQFARAVEAKLREKNT